MTNTKPESDFHGLIVDLKLKRSVLDALITCAEEFRDAGTPVDRRKFDVFVTSCAVALSNAKRERHCDASGRTGSLWFFLFETLTHAGEQGLTTTEVYDALETRGVEANPHTVRSLLSTNRRNGVLCQKDGRYIVTQGALPMASQAA